MNEPFNPPMIVRSLAAGGFVRVNRSFHEKTGYARDELAQKPFLDWIHPGDRQVLRTAMEAGDPKCAVRHLTRDGGSLMLDVDIRDRGESPVVLGLCLESRVVGASLEDSQTDASVKNTLHAIATIVEEQNPGYKCSILLVAHGRFVKGAGPSLPDDYNNAIDGFAIGPNVGSCGTAIYWNVPVIVEDIPNDPLWAPFAELAKKAEVAACWSHPFATKAGSVLGALALYSPVPRAPTAEQISALKAAAQMTGLAVERGRAEEELRIANEIKARFMANMSHEIRTPLNTLIGITDFLEDAEGTIQQNDIRILRESGEQLLELFTGVLELTEVKGRRHRGVVVDLRACCQSICEPLEVAAHEKGLRFACELSEAVPRQVRLDVWSFERVLRLLINNAVKFTDQGAVTVALDFEDRELRVRITDTGCGIDLDRVEELREPFVQGDLSTTKQYAGFGLGLALSDRFMHALGGKLMFESHEPQGTTVSFAIPVSIVEKSVEVDTREAFSPRRATALPVLIVEDNRMNITVIERILSKAGYVCHCCENGVEALQAVGENAYSCILMDCQMPLMDGYEATRRIRRLEDKIGGYTPIIAVTANALAGDRDLCLQAGMDNYLKKPVRYRELVAALQDYAGCPASFEERPA